MISRSILIEIYNIVRNNVQLIHFSVLSFATIRFFFLSSKHFLFFSSSNRFSVRQTWNTVTTIVSKIPKLVRDLAEAEKAVAKEQEEQVSARGSQELTVGDIWASQGM